MAVSAAWFAALTFGSKVHSGEVLKASRNDHTFSRDMAWSVLLVDGSHVGVTDLPASKVQFLPPIGPTYFTGLWGRVANNNNNIYE